MAREAQASHGYLQTMMIAAGVKPQFRPHVLSVLRHPGNHGREEQVLKSLTQTTSEWFTSEKI